MLSRLKTHSPFYVPILVCGLMFYRRQHMFYVTDIKYRPNVYNKKLLNCSECNKLSTTQICFSCWMKMTAYPENI